METKRILMSIGTALAASKLMKSVSGIEVDDVLGTVGLARRRNYFAENLGLIAAGALVGAGAALLMAPSSGRETRRRIGQEASKLGTAAVDAVKERKDEALRSLSDVANGAMTNQHTHHG